MFVYRLEYHVTMANIEKLRSTFFHTPGGCFGKHWQIVFHFGHSYYTPKVFIQHLTHDLPIQTWYNSGISITLGVYGYSDKSSLGKVIRSLALSCKSLVSNKLSLGVEFDPAGSLCFSFTGNDQQRKKVVKYIKYIRTFNPMISMILPLLIVSSSLNFSLSA